MHVLLVEPDELIAHELARRARADGYFVIHASCCRAARSLGVCFDVGVFELDLSDGDGVALASELIAEGVVGRALFFTEERNSERLTHAARLGVVVSKQHLLQELIEALPRTKRPVSHIPPPLRRAPALRKLCGD